MRNPKIGLLPLYLELYDRSTPHIRPGIEKAYQTAANHLRKQNLDVIEAPICRISKEFEAQKADAIVTIHMAYSPSLESEQALAATKLPLIILDTTPDYTFDSTTEVEAMMFNHGIHGVQDMCNLLRRNPSQCIGV